MNRITHVLLRSFHILFALIIMFVIFQASVNNSQYYYDSTLILSTVLALTIMFIGCFFITKFQATIEKKYNYILIIFLVVMYLIQVGVGLYFLRYVPAWDLSAIYNGAIEWLEHGTIKSFEQYFYYYPNNFGGLIFLKFIFSIARLLGITDYFMVATIINSILITLMMWAIVRICTKLLGKIYGIYSIVIMCLIYPFYFIGPVFYTDGLSMVFPAIIYYLYLVSKECSSVYKRVSLYIFMGILTAFGAQIKFTVLIIAIAIIIDILINKQLIKGLVLTLITTITLVVAISMTDTIMYTNLLNKSQAEVQNTPYISWIMMGLKGNGTYNGEDMSFVRSFDSVEDRDTAIKQEIVDRIETYGLSGMFNLIENKTQRCFGDGTLGLSDFLDDSPEKETVFHQFITYDGDYYFIYRTLCHGTFMAILILMLLSGVECVINTKSNNYTSIAPKAAFLGIWLFLMMWESTARYFSNFISMMIVVATMGMIYCIRIIQSLFNHYSIIIQSK